MLRIRITADTFMGVGVHPVEYRLNTAKERVKTPGIHGRVYEPGEEIEVPERHPDGRPFVLNPDAMELLEGTPIPPDERPETDPVKAELARVQAELAELKRLVASERAAGGKRRVA